MDNEFLELYGGLQSHHEEKRQQHFADSAAEIQKRTASSNSILAIGNDSNTPQGNITNITSNSTETVPPPLDTVVGIEPIEMKITDEEVILR